VLGLCVQVRISDKAVAKLMGQVFIEQAALNLLGSVLDTPDFFWESGMKDSMQSVYDKVGASRMCITRGGFIAWRMHGCAYGWVGPSWHGAALIREHWSPVSIHQQGHM
jgi:hypothetical protein